MQAKQDSSVGQSVHFEDRYGEILYVAPNDCAVVRCEHDHSLHIVTRYALSLGSYGAYATFAKVCRAADLGKIIE